MSPIKEQYNLAFSVILISDFNTNTSGFCILLIYF